MSLPKGSRTSINRIPLDAETTVLEFACSRQSYPGAIHVLKKEDSVRPAVRTAVVGAVLVVLGGLADAQSPSAADQIRQRIAEFDRGAPAERNAWLTKDAVIWTGASSKPLMKENDRPDLVAPNRRNNVFKTTLQHLDVSQSGDMAYEISTFTVSYDDDRGHTEGNGAFLRVWKKDGGAWKIAAQFQRPYGDIRPLLSQSR